MEMFNKNVHEERLGPMEKADFLNALREVETYFLKRIKRYTFDKAYDVIADEAPFFDTMGYTEYATNFIIAPLNNLLRLKQLQDAYAAEDTDVKDYWGYFENVLAEKNNNKYKGRKDASGFRKVGNIVVLPGSNKLKERICLNKLQHVHRIHDLDLYLKPHPITTHQFVGELKDIFGEDYVLPRDVDVYHFIKEADTVYTSHISETALYATVLGKEIEPMDVYHVVPQGSFYAINSNLFRLQADDLDRKEWINKTFSDFRSGVINPHVDENWKKKIDAYLEFINAERRKYKDWFIPRKDK